MYFSGYLGGRKHIGGEEVGGSHAGENHGLFTVTDAHFGPFGQVVYHLAGIDGGVGGYADALGDHYHGMLSVFNPAFHDELRFSGLFLACAGQGEKKQYAVE